MTTPQGRLYTTTAERTRPADAVGKRHQEPAAAEVAAG